jgi:MtfA peptidase
MLTWLSEKYRRYSAGRYPWQESWFQAALHRVPALKRLNAAEVSRLRQLVKEFLVDKQFHAALDLRLTESLKVKIATLACLPALYLGYGVMSGWYDIVVYPEAFVAQRSKVDAGTGVVHEYQETLAGEAWQRGPIVLSAADIERDFANPDIGHSVVLHEIAHKIDGLDASVDGVPPLPKREAKLFAERLQWAFDDLNQRIANGQPHWINAYAAQSPQEFFAVATESYFLQPERLQAEFPALYPSFERFYRPESLVPSAS